MPLLNAPLAILSGLAVIVALSEWLERRTAIGKLGAATWTILLGALAANLGLIPSYGNGNATYDALFGPGIQLAIFWLLLRVDLRALWRVGPALLLLFLIGAVSVAIGVPLGLALLGGPGALGEHGAGLGAMYVGTYIGGSPNFFALAELYRVNEAPTLVAAATVVDGGMTALWMGLGVWLPGWLRRHAYRGVTPRAAEQTSAQSDSSAGQRESASLLDLALGLALGAAALSLAPVCSEWLVRTGGPKLPAVLWLTAMALLLAQVPAVARLTGLQNIGLLLIYLFLAAIGALCDLQALLDSGSLGVRLLVVVSVTFLFHGLCIFGAARLFKLAPELAAIASQANIGGGSSALALARALQRPDLALSAVLIGALGSALGTWVGLLVGSVVLGGNSVG
jgi:uncharacterized membrane protein